MLPRPDLVQLLGHATVFVCPSVYEPMGIVNLEAMACEAAVVATAVGGIPEVIDDGVTGVLHPPDDLDRPPKDRRRADQRIGKQAGDGKLEHHPRGSMSQAHGRRFQFGDRLALRLADRDRRHLPGDQYFLLQLE